MKSPQTGNQIISASRCGLDDECSRSAHFSQMGYRAETLELMKEVARAGAAEHLTMIDPSLTYGCVDWYLYPDPKVQAASR